MPDFLCTIQEGIHEGCLQLGRCSICHRPSVASFLGEFPLFAVQQQLDSGGFTIMKPKPPPEFQVSIGLVMEEPAEPAAFLVFPQKTLGQVRKTILLA